MGGITAWIIAGDTVVLRLQSRRNNNSITARSNAINPSTTHRLSPFTGHALTVMLMLACLTRLPLVPLMIIVYDAGVTLHGVMIVSIDVPIPFGGGVTVADENDIDIPLGLPDEVRMTGLLKLLND